METGFGFASNKLCGDSSLFSRRFSWNTFALKTFSKKCQRKPNHTNLTGPHKAAIDKRKILGNTQPQKRNHWKYVAARKASCAAVTRPAGKTYSPAHFSAEVYDLHWLVRSNSVASNKSKNVQVFVQQQLSTSSCTQQHFRTLEVFMRQ